MLLSATGFASGDTLSYKILDLDDNIIQAFTSTNVVERHEIPHSEGTTDGTTASKLVDSTADFVTDGIAIGDFVYNKTDNTKTTVTAVDNLNTLSLNNDIFISGENYSIGDALGFSMYQVEVANTTIINNDGSPFEGYIIWKNTATPADVAIDTITVMDNRLDPRATFVSGNATTFVTSFTETTNDHYKSAWIKFETGVLAQQIRKISSYNGTTKEITLTSALTDTPTSGDVFRLINE